MHDYVVEMLECPACHGPLAWTVAERQEGRVETGEARCRACAATYPVQEGIGVFLTPDLQRDDLWGQMESWLPQYLREHPDIERQLLDAPVETLGPADQLFRAMVLDERGRHEEAREASRLALPGVYTPEYLAACAAQTAFVIERLGAAGGPLVDLASGAGSLVEEMARRLSRPIVATDFSPTVLRADRQRWEPLGLYDRVSLVALDARRTPFQDGAVETLTTNHGLPNIAEPGHLLRELRRVVRGEFLAITNFYPEDDAQNAVPICEMKLQALLYRARALEAFAAAGWHVEVANSRFAKVRPTPRSVLLGAGIDGMPVADTVLEVCVLLAQSQP
ncbi:MAG: methyltransferase domain-containing protein [Candidatus Latescibacterota bacterium]